MKKILMISTVLTLSMSFFTYADISISPLLVYMKSGTLSQNITVTNNDTQEKAYVEISPEKILNPGAAQPKVLTYKARSNPQSFGLMISPVSLKMIVPPSTQNNPGRGMIRVSSLTSSSQDQLYYLHISQIEPPANVKEDQSGPDINFDIDIGYIVKVLVLAQNPKPVVSAVRDGNKITIANSGNSYISLRDGQLCDTQGNNCKPINGTNGYEVLFAGNTWAFKTTTPGVVKFNGVYAENQDMPVQSN